MLARSVTKNITYDKTKQVIGLSKIDSIFDIVDSIVSKNVLGLFESIKACVEESKNISVLSKEICEYLKKYYFDKNRRRKHRCFKKLCQTIYQD